MIGFYISGAMVVAFFGTITLIDWLDRRRQRKSHNRPV